ncbi:MAG: transketolase [Breznakia sp.]
MKKTEDIEQLAKENRKRIVKMIHESGMGHPGGALSMIDMLSAVYEMEVDFKQNPRSKVMLSKGHAVAAQYAVLNQRGIIKDEELKSFRHCNSRLQGHPSIKDILEVDCTTGLLGQGLSLGVGSALAKKMNHDPHYVYVFIGDGELVEGQIWEAMLQAAHYKLDNLVLILDYNKLSSSGDVNESINLENIYDKFKAFNFDTHEIDGNNMVEILNVLEKVKTIYNQPHAIIANTIKGKGVSFMENNPKWHSLALNEEEYKMAMKELEGGTHL